MQREGTSKVLRLWAAFLVAYAVLLHGPTMAADGVELLGCPSATVAHVIGDLGPDGAAHQIDSARLGDNCCALCTTSISKLAIIPTGATPAPPAVSSHPPSTAPRLWLGAPLNSWAEVRGPPGG